MSEKVAFDMTSPCPSCPYRKDAKRRHWAAAEFAQLVHHERNPLPGSVYACHGTGKLPQKRVCAGWLLNQREHDYPSIALRIRLMTDESAVACAEALTDGGNEQFATVAEMVAANYPEIDHD